MQKDSGGNFSELSDSEARITYPGGMTGSWTIPSGGGDPLRAYLPIPSDQMGAIDRLKVRFNYTMPDGTTDYIDSDEVAIWRGTYVGSGSVEQYSSGFIATFPIDTATITDLSGVTISSASVTINGVVHDLTEHASLSDGVVKVGCSYMYYVDFGAGETIDSIGPVVLKLNYKEDGVDWDAEAEGDITLDMSPQVGFDHVYAWSELNVVGGLRRAEVAYSINRRGATINGSVVTISYKSNPSYTKSVSMEGDGDLLAVFTLDDALPSYPSDGWNIDVMVDYTLNGEHLTKTVRTDEVKQFTCPLEITVESAEYVDGSLARISGWVRLAPDADDPYTYSATLTGLDLTGSPLPDPEPTGIPEIQFFIDNDSWEENNTLEQGTSRYFSAEKDFETDSVEQYELTIYAATASGGGYVYVGGLQGHASGPILVSSDSIFTDISSFEFFPSWSPPFFGGSIYLVDGVYYSDLSNISYQVYMDGTDITSQLNPDAYSSSGSDSSGEWIGFFINDEASLSGLSASSTYYVYVYYTYEGADWVEEIPVSIST